MAKRKKKEPNGIINIIETEQGVKLQINNLYSRDHAFYLLAQALTILATSELGQDDPNPEQEQPDDGNVQ